MISQMFVIVVTLPFKAQMNMHRSPLITSQCMFTVWRSSSPACEA